MPRRVVATGWVCRLLRSASTLLSRSEFVLVPADPPAALAEAMGGEDPAAVALIGLPLTRPELDLVARAAAAARQTKIVLVSRQSPSVKLQGAAERFRGARRVFGSGRLRPRVVEAVAEILGTEPRHHFRRINERMKVWLAVEGAPPAAGELINLSRSGAKVSGPWKLSVGTRCELTIEAPDEKLRCTGEVVRIVSAPGDEASYGVRFVEISPTLDLQLGRLVIKEAPGNEPSGFEVSRGFARLSIPKSFALKARMKQPNAERISYLNVVDLSEGGFMASSVGFTPGFAVGDYIDTELLSGHLKVTGQVEILRSVPGTRPNTHSVAVRFHTLSHRDRGVLLQMLFRVRSRGLRGAGATRSTPSLAARGR